MTMKIIAISGSLRKLSLNTLLLQRITQISPPDIEVEIFSRLGEFPLFNPDLSESEQAVVLALKTKISNADAVIIASPEYAHGVTGVMKNALDWMVGNESFVYKPVALLNISPRATHAQAALTEIMTVMSAHVVAKASLTFPILGSLTSPQALAQSNEITHLINVMLQELQQAAAV
jgi:chromate reductase, NAD(P)H dehydrogenase (quinone)